MKDCSEGLTIVVILMPRNKACYIFTTVQKLTLYGKRVLYSREHANLTFLLIATLACHISHYVLIQNQKDSGQRQLH